MGNSIFVQYCFILIIGVENRSVMLFAYDKKLVVCLLNTRDWKE